MHEALGEPDRDTFEVDYLVVIYPTEPSLLGERFPLKESPFCVGRSHDNHLVLDGRTVSRHHARFEQRSTTWVIVDNGSTYGTYCNGEQIVREQALRNGDRVSLGAVILKFLSCADGGAQYYEEIERLAVTDGLTQIHNMRSFFDAFDREIIQSRRCWHDLAVLLFDIDKFKSINDSYGDLASDFVLCEIARLVTPYIRPDHVFARVGQKAFAVVMPEVTREGARTFAEKVRGVVSEHPFIFQNNKIHLTISVGAATLEDADLSSFDLFQRVNHALYVAQREGRDRVVLAPGETDPEGAEIHLTYRPVLDGPSLLETALAQDPPRVLIAFEVAEEGAIVERLGFEVYEEWFWHLLRAVELSLNEGDALATWRDRYVIAALQDTNADAAGELAARTQAAWIARPVPEERRDVPRQVRSAVLTSAELAAHGERALDMLVAPLLDRPPSCPPAGS